MPLSCHYGLGIDRPGNPNNIAEAKRLHADLSVIAQELCSSNTRRQTLIRTQYLMKLQATIIPNASLKKAADLIVTPLMVELRKAQAAICSLAYDTRKAQAKNSSYAQVEVDLRLHQRKGMTAFDLLNPDREKLTRKHRCQSQAKVLIGHAENVNVL